MEKKIKVLEILFLVFFGLALFYMFRYYGSKNNKCDMKESGFEKKELSGYDILLERKSVRNYVENKSIPDSLLNLIVRAGMAAPSARNVQPWEFIIVNDREVLDRMADSMPYGKMLYKAPAAIVVCGNLSLFEKDGSDKYWVQDCSAATENVLLAAEALGLGGVWLGTWPDEKRSNFISDILGLPDSVLPLSVISLGYPTGVEKSKDKYKPEKIHYNKY